MSYIDHNPRVAWAEGFDSGIRTQACADLAEAGAKVQTSGIKSGGCYNDHYIPVYSAVRKMERESPVLAAVGHWLCLVDTGEANWYLDDVADSVLTRFVATTPEWSSYRKARRQRVEALVYARLMMDRLNMDGERRPWQPLEICEFVYGHQGVKIVSYNWQRDGWEKVWDMLGRAVAALECEAMEPVIEASRSANRAMRHSEKYAA
ncbi:hypothetical protein KUW00_19765 [Halomonas sp. DP5N14-9]|uniref:hypothetical protein n=1 Tax=Halomonas sp. DP5N14-9 TaxID=2859075 RepID=UPI001C99FE86|nr:hypothetical protein [Halomonas sp. DP5N14-9]MBY5943117.1 hypothetical protein [Halomonas sp. DP5N14-9]